MRMLMTVTAAAIAATAMISSAFAEGFVGCDSALPDGSVQADSCSEWNRTPAPQAYAPAPMQYGASAYGYAPHRDRGHRMHNKTDVHGGAGN